MRNRRHPHLHARWFRPVDQLHQPGRSGLTQGAPVTSGGAHLDAYAEFGCFHSTYWSCTQLRAASQAASID